MLCSILLGSQTCSAMKWVRDVLDYLGVRPSSQDKKVASLTKTIQSSLFVNFGTGHITFRERNGASCLSLTYKRQNPILEPEKVDSQLR